MANKRKEDGEMLTDRKKAQKNMGLTKESRQFLTLCSYP
jgi:hypothetical protein